MELARTESQSAHRCVCVELQERDLCFGIHKFVDFYIFASPLSGLGTAIPVIKHIAIYVTKHALIYSKWDKETVQIAS